MNVLCYILSALSFGYFLLIAVYSGISTDFCGIWIAIGLVFLVMGFFSQKARKDVNGMPKRLPIFLHTTFVLWAAVTLFIFLSIFRYGMTEDTEGCDYCIVMGDRIYEDGISSTLKKRLDRAIRYSEDNPSSVLVLSGGTDSGDAFPEALAMYNYMVLNGVDDKRLLIEAQSVTTGDNLENSLRIIRTDLKTRLVPPPVMIGVLTSDFHVFRCMKVSEKITKDELYPVVAESDPILYVHQCVRECCAIIRDRLQGTI